MSGPADPTSSVALPPFGPCHSSRGAERRCELAQRRDRRIGVAVLDLDERALADVGERGEAVERQPPIAAPRLDALGEELHELTIGGDHAGRYRSKRPYRSI